MPSVLTHYGFNKEVFDKGFDFLKGNEDVYFVGAQGPDPFLFRGLMPSFNNKGSSLIRKFGSKLHKVEPSEVFYLFFKYAINKNNKDVLFSYILGAGLHYILDRKIHPYVYYKSGFSDNTKMKAKYFVNHTLFETNMDVLLMDGRFSKYKVKPIESIKCDLEKIQEISKMYESLANELFEEYDVRSYSFMESYKNMMSVEKLLYSKTGVKKKIVSCLLKQTPLNTMMHSKKIKDDDKIDYLNLKHDSWQDPESEVVYNKSVYDLIDEAINDANEWKKIVLNAYNDRLDLEEIKRFTKDMIYDGHNKDSKMKVFKNVFVRKEKEK